MGHGASELHGCAKSTPKLRLQMSSSIFIVGVPRSGTTLLAAMLAAHSRLSGGPETHFFARLSSEAEKSLAGGSDWPQSAVETLFSIVHADKPVPLNYGITADEITAYLDQKEPSVAAALEALTDLQRVRLGKARWVEKTPDHLPHVSRIRRHFPDAKILRIVRDPRDVVLSLLRVPWGPTTFFDALLFWRQYDRSSRKFFESDRNSLTLRYEDLVARPEAELRRICTFLGEEFEPIMLDTTGTAKIVDCHRRPWHEKLYGGVDQSRAGAWESTFTVEQVQLADAILGDRLRELGYATGECAAHYAQLFPEEFLSKSESLVEDLSRNCYRFWSNSEDEAPEVLVFLGTPSCCSRGNVARRWLRRFRVAARLTMHQLRGGKVIWANRIEPVSTSKVPVASGQ